MLRLTCAGLGVGVALFLSAVAVQRTLEVAMPLNLGALLAGLFLLSSAALGLRAAARRDPPRGGLPRRIAFAVLRVLAIVFLVAWWVWRAPAPMGEGPAGPEVPAAAFESTWREGPVLMISLGDSVSTGFGVRRGLGYFALMQENDDAFHPSMRGRELRRVLPALQELRKAEDSTHSMRHLDVIRNLPVQSEDTFGLVCMTTGGIDLIHDYGRSDPEEGSAYGASLAQAAPWIARFEERLELMVRELRQRFPGGMALLLATIYDPTDGVGDIENAGPMFWLPPWPDALAIHGRYNDALRAVAGRHPDVHLADMHAALLGHGIHCGDADNPHHDPDDPSYWYYLNLEDPNERGYDAIRRVFLNAAIEAMAPPR